MQRPCTAYAVQASIGLCAIAALAPLALPARADGSSTPAGPPSAPASSAQAPAAQAAALAALFPKHGQLVRQVLNQTVDWYRMLDTQQQAASEPSDWSIYYENRQIAAQVLAQAFAAARASADLLEREQPEAAPAAGDRGISPQRLAAVRAKLEAQGSSVQAKLDAAREQLRNSPAAAVRDVQAEIADLQVALNLIDTRKGILDSVIDVVQGVSTDEAHALREQIDAMAAALPAAYAAAAHAGTAAPAGGAAVSASSAQAAAVAALPTPRSGLWDLAANMFSLSSKRSMIASADERTAALQAVLAHIRGPLIDQLRAFWVRGDALVAQAETADRSALEGKHGEFEQLATLVKGIAAVLIPIGKADNLLTQYRRNLVSWRTAVEDQTHSAARNLAIRLGVLLGVLGVLFLIAELTRRTVLTYVQDAQRRHQLMLVRRTMFWAAAAVIVVFAFVGQFGSAATFAGLLTAGLALAMQSVLVSIVGYFFLIGRHGIRIGDRVQIGQVSGEVIELGLLRLYLMECSDKGSRGPTGRVVAFANSVVFQVTGGLFKQIPGVDIVWHDMSAKFPVGTDHASLKKKLLEAVLDALADYRKEIERQTREIQRSTASSSAGDAMPTVHLHFSPSGIDAHVRYPVHLQHAEEIDERVAHAVLKVVAAAGPAGAPPA